GPTKNEAAASICRWTASGRGDGASGTWMCRDRECAQGCAPERCTIPPVGRRPRPEPHTSGALAHAPERCTISPVGRRLPPKPTTPTLLSPAITGLAVGLVRGRDA